MSASDKPAKGGARLKQRLKNIKAMDAANRSGMSGATRAYLIVAVHLVATAAPILLTILIAPLYIPLVLLARPVVRYTNIWVRVMSDLACILGAILTGTRIRRDPELNVPERGYFILVNHVNEFEFHFDRYVIRKPFLANQALKVSPFIYAGLRLGAGITFDEFDGRDMVASLERVKGILSETSVLVYPEGRRTFSEEIQNLKTGVLKLAFKRQIPVAPVMKTGMSRLRAFGNELVYFSPGTVDPAEYTEFGEFFDAVVELMTESKREHNEKVL